MGFDTMASFRLLLQSMPNSTGEEPLSAHSVKRQDSFTMFSDTKRRQATQVYLERNIKLTHSRGGVWGPDIPVQQPPPQKTLRPNKPTSLPVPSIAPSFQAAKSKWSPPASPGIAPGTISLSGPPRATSKERNDLANQLFKAACAGDTASIESLLEQGAPVNSSVLVPSLFEAFRPAKAGQLSPLAGACLKGQLKTVKLLLAQGAELNPASNRSSSSPLHQACRNDDIEMVRYLLEQGAEVDIIDAYKVTPVMYASKYSSVDLISLLLDHKPNLHAMSFIGAAAIHWSVWPGKVEIAELLLLANAKPNQEMADGNTALHCAVLAGSVEMCKVLLRYGADPLRENKSEETPLNLAETQCETNDISMVLKAAISARR